MLRFATKCYVLLRFDSLTPVHPGGAAAGYTSGGAFTCSPSAFHGQSSRKSGRRYHHAVELADEKARLGRSHSCRYRPNLAEVTGGFGSLERRSGHWFPHGSGVCRRLSASRAVQPTLARDATRDNSPLLPARCYQSPRSSTQRAALFAAILDQHPGSYAVPASPLDVPRNFLERVRDLAAGDKAAVGPWVGHVRQRELGRPREAIRKRSAAPTPAPGSHRRTHNAGFRTR
jgi:hypothetical protein